MKRFFVFFLLISISAISFSQIRIDWQQCYGSMKSDNAQRIVKKSYGYRISGDVKEQSGMVSIPLSYQSWVIDIDETGNLINQFSIGCYARICEDYFADYDGRYDYAIGLPPNELGKYQLGIKKLDDEGNVVWETLVGNPNKSFWDYCNGTCTADGGVLATTTTQWNGGYISNYHGGDDAWVAKIDSLGNLEWETTLGTENFEFPICLKLTSDGCYYVTMDGNPGYTGSIPVCQVPSTDIYDCIIAKLDVNGNLMWSNCYGGSKTDGIKNMIELSDGFLLVCETESDDRDAEGAGYHLGYYNYYQTPDIWLIRTDLDGNIIWSKCYGGTGMEFSTNAFQNEDGGFTVFGTTQSIDGDAQSAQRLYVPWTGSVFSKLWVFRIDADGNMIWEKAIGTKMSRDIRLEDVVRLSETEYTILSTAHPPAEGYEGDFSCTNWDNRLCGYDSYWVLHITDIFDYDAVEEGQIEARNMSVYPNPAQGMLTVSGKDIRQVCLYDLLGQQVATAPSYNGSNAMLSTSGLAEGIYMVQVRTENGTCVKRVVVSK